jgi:hypothetical protein
MLMFWKASDGTLLSAYVLPDGFYCTPKEDATFRDFLIVQSDCQAIIEESYPLDKKFTVSMPTEAQ